LRRPGRWWKCLTFAKVGGLGRIAQLVEQLTLNQRVQGSNPCAPTIFLKNLAAVAIFIPMRRAAVIPTKWPILFSRQTFDVGTAAGIPGPYQEREHGSLVDTLTASSAASEQQSVVNDALNQLRREQQLEQRRDPLRRAWTTASSIA
jgi:hypothetical protein